MDLLQSTERQILQDYEARLSGIKTQQYASQIMRRTSANQTESQDEDRPQIYIPTKQKRQSAALLTSSAQPLSLKNQHQQQQRHHHHLPLNGKSPAEFVNERIKSRMDYERDSSEEDRIQQQQQFHSAFPRRPVVEEQEFIQQGRFQIPSISVFTKTSGPQRLSKDIDICEIVTTKQSVPAKKIGRVTSSELSSRIESVLQSAAFADQMLKEKHRILTNMTQSNVPMNKYEIAELFDQLLPIHKPEQQTVTPAAIIEAKNDQEKCAQLLEQSNQLEHVKDPNTSSNQVELNTQQNGLAALGLATLPLAKIVTKKDTKDKIDATKKSTTKSSKLTGSKSNNKLPLSKSAKNTGTTRSASKAKKTVKPKVNRY